MQVEWHFKQLGLGKCTVETSISLNSVEIS